MKKPALANSVWVPAALAILAVAALGLWLGHGSGKPLALRVPGTDHDPGVELGTNNPVLLGKLIPGEGRPSDLPGAWPQFRGQGRDGIGQAGSSLLRAWQNGEPRELWAIDVGDGYAGPAILNGRVYLMDYDVARKQDALRCLSLQDGRELWRFAYPVNVKRNHGMSRTTPAVDAKLLVAIGPKCHVLCLDPATGQLRWTLDLVRDFGATVPQWYAGQCPLIDQGSVILAPGGKDALLASVNSDTGAVRWQTPNPRGWKMTHSSIVTTELGGRRMYVYCADKGVVGVSAQDGSLLWETTDWKISIATVPSPIPLGDGRIFLSGGYNAGSLMLQLETEGDRFIPRVLFKLPPEVFGATQHTPILYQDHLYGVRADGRFVCLTLDGKTVWASDSSQQFGLGPFLLVNGLIYAMNDSGLLRLIQASPEKYSLLAQAQVLRGHDSWGPLALAGNRLIARDLTRMVCLQVGQLDLASP